MELLKLKMVFEIPSVFAPSSDALEYPVLAPCFLLFLQSLMPFQNTESLVASIQGRHIKSQAHPANPIRDPSSPIFVQQEVFILPMELKFLAHHTESFQFEKPHQQSGQE